MWITILADSLQVMLRQALIVILQANIILSVSSLAQPKIEILGLKTDIAQSSERLMTGESQGQSTSKEGLPGRGCIRLFLSSRHHLSTIMRGKAETWQGPIPEPWR
jgi:hypothetical protein